MRTKDLIIISLLLAITILFTADIVNYELTGNHLFRKTQPALISISQTKCADNDIKSRSASFDSQLKIVSEYERVCRSTFIDNVMIFTNMPISAPNAVQLADKMTERLSAFKDYEISPIVIVEPDSEWGLIDFREYAAGDYDEWMSVYFNRLKENGITDSMMGLWIPFPEPQQTYWNNSTPDDFATSSNRYFTTLRKSFPKARTGILLDSQVGEDSQTSQLLAYTRLLDNRLVDVAGLQGFPWHPSDEGDLRKPVTLASEFASANLLDQVAKSIDTREVLLNIGTYRHRKASNGGDIAITLVERQTTLDSIVHETSKLTDKQYSVTVNVFAENKFDSKEGVDWSYWQSGRYTDSDQSRLFTSFIRKLERMNTEISIFDTAP